MRGERFCKVAGLAFAKYIGSEVTVYTFVWDSGIVGDICFEQ